MRCSKLGVNKLWVDTHTRYTASIWLPFFLHNYITRVDTHCKRVQKKRKPDLNRNRFLEMCFLVTTADSTTMERTEKKTAKMQSLKHIVTNYQEFQRRLEIWRENLSYHHVRNWFASRVRIITRRYGERRGNMICRIEVTNVADVTLSRNRKKKGLGHICEANRCVTNEIGLLQPFVQHFCNKDSLIFATVR